MNILRTIQACEEQWWVEEFFQPIGRADGPAVPFRFPFPHQLQKQAQTAVDAAINRQP